MSGDGIGTGKKGGGDAGKQKPADGGFWGGLKSIVSGVMEGFLGGTGASSSRGATRRDPVAEHERPAAARQIHRSMKAWRDRESDNQKEDAQQDQSNDAQGTEELESDPSQPTPVKRKLVPRSPGIGAPLSGIGLKIFRAAPEDQAKVRALAEQEAKKLLEVAAANEEGITSALVSIATANGGQMQGLEHRLKGLESLARKISERAEVKLKRMTVEEAVNEQVMKINDALRYTVQLPPDGFRKAGAAIKSAMEGKGFSVTAERNFWDSAAIQEFPYRGVNMTLKSEKGQVFELQFHTPDSLAMKTALHGLYEEWRANGTPKARKKAIEKIMLDKWKTVPVPT